MEGWRRLKIGPPYLRIGHRVIYRLSDIEAYEAKHLCNVLVNGRPTPSVVVRT